MMAKAKITNKGNVQVTMTHTQWEVVMSVLNHCRLGSDNVARAALSDICIDLSSFNDTYDFGSGEFFKVTVTKEKKDGFIKEIDDFCIEVGVL